MGKAGHPKTMVPIRPKPDDDLMLVLDQLLAYLRAQASIPRYMNNSSAYGFSNHQKNTITLIHYMYY